MDNQKYQLLEDEYKRTKDKKARIDLLIKMTREKRDSDAERALYMAEQIIQESGDIDYTLGIGEGFNHKGACYWLMGEYEEGLDQLAEAYAIAKEIKDRSLESKVLNNFGRIYRNIGDLSHALRNFESALEINNEDGDDFGKTISLSNISNIYYDLEDYDTALEYSLKCLPIFEEDNDPNRLFTSYSNLGDIYFKQEKFDKALLYFQKSLDITPDNPLNRTFAHSGLGKVYYKLGNYEKGESYLKSAIEQARELNNAEAQIVAEFYLGKVKAHFNDIDKAIEHSEIAYKLAKRAMRKRDLLSIHEFLSVLYEKKGEIQKAFDNLRCFERLRGEIFQQSTFNKLRNLQLKTQMQVAQKEKEVAERTARIKQQFMASMSHEIRTPMNAIVGITRLLLEKDPREDQLRYLEAIQQSSDNLLVIINDILDFSKIEAGKIQLEFIDFSFRKLISSMKEMMFLKASQKGLEFNIFISDDIPDTLIGDPTRINQILINLVSNAIKFTEEGHVNINCIQDPIPDSKQILLQISVADTGIGIPKKYLKTIFDSFTQASTDTTRKYGGTGLGLTITKQLVNMMGGKINVESIFGAGTTFSVQIPITIAENQEINEDGESISTDSKKDLSGIAILLVEDNEFNQMVAQDTLENLIPSVKIEIAENGEVAIEKLKETDFDLILMDIQMPVMNGVEATKYIRNNFTGKKREIPIIAMTANVIKEDVKRYMASGMDAYVSKPFKTEELISKMKSALKGQIDTIKENDNEKRPIGLKMPEKVTDERFLKQFTGGNAEKEAKYIKMFLDNCPKLLAQIHEGMEKADFEKVRIAAHSMKPQLSYMGVSEDTSNILLIEKAAGQGVHQERLSIWVNHLQEVCEKAFEELNAVLRK